jgi:hypothetical protein
MAIDISIAEVHFRSARWLVKSSAGKLSRQANRDRLLESKTESTTQ